MLFRSVLFAIFLPAILSSACATVPVAQLHGNASQTVITVPRSTPLKFIPGAPMDTTYDPALDDIPAFSATPLMKWGPLPPGTVHIPRVRTYDLQHQAISIRFDWPRHAVIGTTTLTVAALDTGIMTIHVDAVGMQIKRIYTAVSPALTHTYDDTVLAIHFPTALPVHVAVPITIEYETVRPKKGAYFIDRVHYLWTQGETSDTRYWVPTYDSPNDKTTWEITVITDPDEQALSNGRLLGSKRVAAGTQWIWVQDKPASTYLMSVVTGKYTVIRDHWHDVPVDYWVYPDSVEAGRRGFAHTPQAIEVFSQKLGVPYPWAKYDQSAVPDFIFGGMENVTATTQHDEILHPAWEGGTPATAWPVVAHELAHQWFGDLLTTDTWAHSWLNEGFATFMTQIYRETAEGVDPGAMDRWATRSGVIRGDREERRPLVDNRWVKDPIELFLTGNGYIYYKGDAVLQMLRHRFGDKLFWMAMHHYVTSHAYQTVVTSDLEKAFEEVTKQNLKQFFNQWVYGAGFPVFQVSYSYNSTTRQITLHAREVQPRDSLTGYFDADVDVEVLTEHSAVHGVMPVRGEIGEMTLQLDGPPRSIHWNKGQWLLEQHDFPRPTRMIICQLLNDDDILGRLEALTLLRTRGPSPVIQAAIAQAARFDKAVDVRTAALTELAALHPDTTFQRTIVQDVLHDPDPRVRIRLLKMFPRGATATELAAIVQHDSSFVVRGEALAAYLTVAGEAGLPFVEQVMAAPSWPRALCKSALLVLAMMPGPKAQALHQRYAR